MVIIVRRFRFHSDFGPAIAEATLPDFTAPVFLAEDFMEAFMAADITVNHQKAAYPKGEPLAFAFRF